MCDFYIFGIKIFNQNMTKVVFKIGKSIIHTLRLTLDSCFNYKA